MACAAIPKPRKVRQRIDNRQQTLLDAAAKLFRTSSFEAISVRDIAKEAGMLPGSVYYHFPSKDDLLVAVYKAGIAHHLGAARAAIASADTPVTRLAALCRAHVGSILGNDFAAVAVCVLPRNSPALRRRLVALRDTYEDVFRDLIATLPLAPGVNRKILRLTLLGALNYIPIWYHAGLDDPDTTADKILARFADGERRAA